MECKRGRWSVTEEDGVKERNVGREEKRRVKMKMKRS